MYKKYLKVFHQTYNYIYFLTAVAMGYLSELLNFHKYESVSLLNPRGFGLVELHIQVY